MRRDALPSVVVCVLLAAALGATMFGRQEAGAATIAKSIAIVGILVMAASIAFHRRRSPDA